ncbi:cellobiohydrolase [Crepidotus variabilis]|uniref:Glucanase n=1 Tax=Crepidotus variabilis TaxID=179855 RepID=A0A9P6EDJ8_9AGAR|nr:cellobiohydrolase [Crepidotus variabilis]
MVVLRTFLAGIVFVPLAALSTPATTRDNVNPYIGKNAFANKGYAAKLEATIDYFNAQSDKPNAARTKLVQKIPTFSWLSYSVDVPGIKGLVADALQAQTTSSQKQVVQLVVYNLPDRDCSAKASDGEFHLIDDGLNKYKAFIDAIFAQLTTIDAKKLDFVLIIEPDALANVITSMDFEKCRNAASAYKEGIRYAITKFQLPNVALYLDAGHGGWLGSSEELEPTAQLFAQVLKSAQKSSPATQVRGLAINVSNYNQYIAPVRENYTEGSPSWDEFHYVNSLLPRLKNAGYPTHFIVDQGRAGKAGIRTGWEEWCNLQNAGFGTRPTSDQAVLKNDYVDSIVWVKPGGESDGTSDKNSVRFDNNCVSPVAHIPAPEAGQWFNEYVVNLVKNAEPPLEPSAI